jgi:hypothetical protein
VTNNASTSTPTNPTNTATNVAATATGTTTPVAAAASIAGSQTTSVVAETATNNADTDEDTIRNQKLVEEFQYLLEKSQSLFSGLRYYNKFIRRLGHVSNHPVVETCHQQEVTASGDL